MNLNPRALKQFVLRVIRKLEVVLLRDADDFDVANEIEGVRAVLEERALVVQVETGFGVRDLRRRRAAEHTQGVRLAAK